MSEGLIRYEKNDTILFSVPAVKSIKIKASALTIKGNGESDYAFIGACSTIKSITFEEDPQLQSIQKYSFYKCSLLEFIDISSCTKLTSIGDRSFMYCSKLTSISLPLNLQILGSYSFSCTGLRSIFIPVSVTTINSYAFCTCSSLTSIVLDENCQVEYLTSHQFQSTKLTNFTLTKNIRSITGDFAEFVYTMTKYIVSKDNKYLSEENDAVFDYGKTKVFAVPPGKTGEFTIPDTVKLISYTCFTSSRLTKVNLPSNLETIYPWAFFASAITSIDIPKSCTKIDACAFCQCKQIKSVVLNGVKSIGASCFDGCSNLESVKILSNLTALGGGAFTGCAKNLSISFGDNSDLTIDAQYLITDKQSKYISQCLGSSLNYTISSTITSIKSKAFINNKLERIIFNGTSSLTTIESNAFSNCINLIEFAFPNSLTAIGSEAFSGCIKLRGLQLGKNLASIGNSAFKSCTGLTELTFSSGRSVNLGDNAFYGCKGIENINFNRRVSSIGASCFESCTSLSSIIIDPSVKTIGKYAFSSTGIRECTFSSDSTNARRSLDETLQLTSLSSFLFYNSLSLTSISFSPWITTLESFCLSKTSIDSIELPQSVSKLGEGCFKDCSRMTIFSIPQESQLTTIEYDVFLGCTEFSTIKNECDRYVLNNGALYNKLVTELIIFPPKSNTKFFSFPETVQTIGIGALQGCTSILVIFIPQSIGEIKPYAFTGCSNLRSVNIPMSVKTVGMNAFSGCKKLQCGIVIENQTGQYINNIVNIAKLPLKCVRSCSSCYAYKASYKKNNLLLVMSAIIL